MIRDEIREELSPYILFCNPRLRLRLNSLMLYQKTSRFAQSSLPYLVFKPMEIHSSYSLKSFRIVALLNLSLKRSHPAPHRVGSKYDLYQNLYLGVLVGDINGDGIVATSYPSAVDMLAFRNKTFDLELAFRSDIFRGEKSSIANLIAIAGRTGDRLRRGRLSIESAVSRRHHGGIPLDIDLLTSGENKIDYDPEWSVLGTVVTEPRVWGPREIVVEFDDTVPKDIQVEGTHVLIKEVHVNGKTVTVEITPKAKREIVAIHFHAKGINDRMIVDESVYVGVLEGDVNGDGYVDASTLDSSVSMTEAGDPPSVVDNSAQAFSPRQDINVDGRVNDWDSVSSSLSGSSLRRAPIRLVSAVSRKRHSGVRFDIDLVKFAGPSRSANYDSQRNPGGHVVVEPRNGDTHEIVARFSDALPPIVDVTANGSETRVSIDGNELSVTLISPAKQQIIDIDLIAHAPGRVEKVLVRESISIPASM